MLFTIRSNQLEDTPHRYWHIVDADGQLYLNYDDSSSDRPFFMGDHSTRVVFSSSIQALRAVDEWADFYEYDVKTVRQIAKAPAEHYDVALTPIQSRLKAKHAERVLADVRRDA